MKTRHKLATLSLAVTAIALMALPAVLAGCSSALQSPAIPYIPPAYYNCTETTVDTLLQVYFNHYNAVAGAELIFNGQVFVFKNIVISDASLKYATEDYIWVNGVIQCYFLKSGSARQLKVGDKVDVVGVDAGICKEYSGSLVFNGCIFLPAGSVQLPAGGTSALSLPSY